MSAQVIDYSTLTDRELDVEIAKRLGLTFRDWDGLEICEVHSGAAHWVFKSYAGDANAALELFQGYSIGETFNWFNLCTTKEGQWSAGILPCPPSSPTSIVRGTPARAICECWLKYQDAKR